jgi:hypothetical protein
MAACHAALSNVVERDQCHGKRTQGFAVHAKDLRHTLQTLAGWPG